MNAIKVIALIFVLDIVLMNKKSNIKQHQILHFGYPSVVNLCTHKLINRIITNMKLRKKVIFVRRPTPRHNFELPSHAEKLH